jgi:hypothetical protein
MFWSHSPVAPWQDERWLAEMRRTLRPNAYQRLVLNEFASAESQFVDMSAWDQCVQPTLMPTMERIPIYVGVDASVKRDSTLAQPLPSLLPRQPSWPCPRRAHPAAPPSASTAPIAVRPSDRVRSSPRAAELMHSPPPCAPGPAKSVALPHSMAAALSAVQYAEEPLPPRSRLNGAGLRSLPASGFFRR